MWFAISYCVVMTQILSYMMAKKAIWFILQTTGKYYEVLQVCGI